jgi:hypothetical protein
MGSNFLEGKRTSIMAHVIEFVSLSTKSKLYIGLESGYF